MTQTVLLLLLKQDKDLIQHCVKYFSLKDTSKYLQEYGIKLKIKMTRGLQNGNA